MKIQCDVCNREEATVFCSADEAALCDGCDHRVHHANKLAGKHQRFSLLHPTHHFPLCDICQERRAFLFCQQDRAILCRECDISIHRSNQHTQTHTRFLLTGVKLSAVAGKYSPSSSSSVSGGCDPVPQCNSSIDHHHYQQKPASSSLSAITNPPIGVSQSTPENKFGNLEGQSSGGRPAASSSISEYLIEMLPGWHVEDFLDSSPSPSGFCKSMDENSPNWETNIESNLENRGIWVPRGPSQILYPSSAINGGGQTTNMKSSRKWRDDEDGCSRVPQISSESKRSRNIC